MSRLLMCVDPGHANAGAVIVDPSLPEGQEIVTMRLCQTARHDQKLRYRVADDQARRSQELARFYSDLIREFSIRRYLAELPSGGAPNSCAATDLARAATVLIAVAEVYNCAAEWYSPEEVKTALTGKRKATKDEMMLAAGRVYPAVDRLFTAKSRREHVCDAIGVWWAGRKGTLARLD